MKKSRKIDIPKLSLNKTIIVSKLSNLNQIKGGNIGEFIGGTYFVRCTYDETI